MKIGAPTSVFLALWIAFPIASMAGLAPDSGDGDGVPDVLDNCTFVANAAPEDCDTDNDGFGNKCDGDFDNDQLVTGSPDFIVFKDDLKAGTDSGVGTDMNCDGFVTGSPDFGLFKAQIQEGAPGPSGLSCAGTVPCP